jgi:DNA gyrase subunit A
MLKEGKIVNISIEKEMQTAYRDYSMSVIVSRALPDVRDGFKPVHRRILYSMYKLGMLSNKPYKKSARIVGDVLAKYHPHGDSSVYDTMVRMAQAWSLRYLLIDGQGNFGSIDGDYPAAMRYTEARLHKIAEEMLIDIEKETVDMQLNFDDSINEPTVLPTRIPNLLINGTSGIAVGMATNMPPYNLIECINAICSYIDNKNIDLDNIMKYIKAPDFPTGGIIYGYQGVKEALHTGRGKIILRGKITIEEINNRICLIVKEIPYLVNKSDLITKTVNLIKTGKLDGIYNIIDESDRQGLRLVYVLKTQFGPIEVLKNLFKYTNLQTTFTVNTIALVNGKPVLLNIKDLIRYFVDYRHKILIRRTKFDLQKVEERIYILQGFIIALDNMNLIVSLIKNSKNHDNARKKIIEKFKISDIQARSILDMKLQKFTSLEREKIKFEYDKLSKTINKFNKILSQEELRMQIIKKELIEIKDKYGDLRRTIIDNYDDKYYDTYDNINTMVITIYNAGYIKKTPISEYKRQTRASPKNEYFLEHMLIANNHQYMLFFTEKGKCFGFDVYKITEGKNKGSALKNIIPLSYNDKVKSSILIDKKNLNNDEYKNTHYVVIVTKKGFIKKTPIKHYYIQRKIGIKAINIRPHDSILEAKLTNGSSEIFIALNSGKAIRFTEEKVRSMGRISYGVLAITLNNENDRVIGMECIDNTYILVVSDKGYCNKSHINDYRITDRGGKGIKTINITEKTGKLIYVKNVSNQDDIMIIKKSGVTIHIAVTELEISGRTTQGVKLIKLKKTDEISTVTQLIY